MFERNSRGVVLTAAGQRLLPYAVRLCPAPMLLRALMLLATAAFFACAVPVSLQWFFIWRLLSGISGGALMVLAAPIVLPHVSHRR